jgi:hypothetical protein
MITRRNVMARAASTFAPAPVARAAGAGAATPDELARYLPAETAKWEPAIRPANIRMDG